MNEMSRLHTERPISIIINEQNDNKPYGLWS